ncbi:MAG: MMPL family transporter [Acidobacteriota bacterium]
MTLLTGSVLSELTVDNSIEVWIDREGEAYRTYQEFLDAFGSEEYILLVYRLPDPVELDFLQQLTDVRWSLEEIAGIEQAQCLSSVYSRFFSLLGLEAFREELRESPLYRDFLVSADGRYGAIWLVLGGREQMDRGAIVEAVRAALADNWPGERVYLAGSPVIDEALDSGSRRSAQKLFPLVFLLSALLLLAFFQRPYGLVVPFVSVGAGIVWTLALMQVAGRSINMVTLTLPPLLWVLGLSTSIHLLSRTRQLLAAGIELPQAIRQSMRELARPCIYSAVTTALGFGSLMASSMHPVQEMGLFSAVGILLCLASNFLLFPSLARLCPPRPRANTVEEHPVLAALGRLIARHARWIVVGASVIAVVLVVSLLKLRAESNVIAFFKRDAPISITYREVLSDFTGPYSVEILLTPTAPVSSAEVLRRVERLEVSLAEAPGVAKVLSVVDFVKKSYQRTLGEAPSVHRLPDSEAALAEAWQDTELQLGDELQGFYDSEQGTLRLSVLAQPMSSEQHRELLSAIRAELDALDAEWRPRSTGIVPLLVEMQDRLLESQIRSIALAFLLIGPVIALLLRSVRYAALSLAPNLTPILLALGTMAWLDIALDPATVMIAGIALGIGVDDTIHFLTRYLTLRHEELGLVPAVDSSLQTVGRAMVRTSVITAIGFFVLCFAEFLPLLYFGLFTAIAMLAALIAAMIVLPALLLLMER